jgi:pantetheine-phosphate adenylyltransferase
MEKIAVFPGSFDPITVGHESIVRRALALFDKVIIAIGQNSEKKSYFSIDQRMEWIKKVFEDDSRVIVESYSGLTVEFCRNHNARYILRGLRTAADFEFERAIAQVNKAMFSEIESVFLLTLPEHTPINSTIVREILKNGGDISKFVPKVLNLKGKS